MRRIVAILVFLLTAASAQAQEGRFRYLGHGRLVVNDVFADRLDRWRTGSVAASHVFGRGWSGTLPDRPGALLEFRVLGEVIAPARLDLAWNGDRPYSQALSFGLHSHFRRGGWEMAAGADVVVTGPQTGLMDFQHFLHRVSRFDHTVSAQVRAAQIPNGVHGAAVFEAGRSYTLTDGARLRPFLELRAGVEDMVRIGFDFALGPAGRGDLMVRDPVTGHRYRALNGSANGSTFVFGADVAKVAESLYLPASRNTLTDARVRVRTGVHWQTDRWRGFYGMAWLGPEFERQFESQVIGAVRLQYRF
ncbi:hypothetical protein OB2597_09274 [Pseudooceanicola batsensis HTCC2597]|uniref:Lipid A deacylase LpxR family protein n=1 Tax=Pseudooceanicola batsensis (strain ATCC BAA-863 / DSM 15984 / KCTC 12145 / HTCC2597) TaxID=252305 RepID=A3TUX7_PSEBH|nr:lipid A-modifier LpxR family protein [Pseudooceanicola batsensis]EAQ04323.1 hypothetical protein OB2597_09274 [Pseudooceanicola batsensis HTCC2597]